MQLQKVREIFLKLRPRALREGWNIDRDHLEFIFELEDGIPVKIRNPNAFFLAALVDRQVRAEVAWKLPLELKKRIGSIEPKVLANMPYERLVEALSRPPALHRMPQQMAKYIQEAMKLLERKYRGNAGNIWNDVKSYDELYRRLREFPGVGDKIASMVIRMFFDYFHFPVAGDIPVDRNDVRVVRRLTGGRYTPKDFARALFPENPLLADSVLFYIGRNFCTERTPNCMQCPLKEVCNYACKHTSS